MKRLYASFLAGAALIALATPALAQNPKIDALEQQLHQVEQELAQIKVQQSDSDTSAAVIDLKRSTSDQYKDINDRLESRTHVGFDDGRFTLSSPSGAFTLSLKGLVQFDYGSFSQGKNPASVDLNSGTNFRRAQIGLIGTAWKDWSYNFTYDFGGNGVEKNGYIYYAYIEYDGLKPFAIRAGAMTPFLAIEDSTGSGDLMFLERPTSVDIARNIGGAPGREGIEAFAQGDTYLVSLAYTGKKSTDTATFDAQQAILGRASWLAINQPDVKWLVDGHFTQLLHPADAAANTDTSNVLSFSNGTELAVDASKTVNTGNIDARRATEFGFESAAEYAGLYAQGGWFHYEIDRRTALSSPHFSGWYLQGSYSLTGEQHGYDPTTASFRGLKPAHPLGTPGGWGAWEITGRYSNIDLDYLPLATTAAGGVAGGQQNVWNVGVNWYPTNGLRFVVDYYNIQVNHVNAPANDISANAIGIRSQISF